MTACMGGWCQKRDKCRSYTAKSTVIVERLCEAGDDDAYEPLRLTREAGTWERKAPGLAVAGFWDALA